MIFNRYFYIATTAAFSAQSQQQRSSAKRKQYDNTQQFEFEELEIEVAIIMVNYYHRILVSTLKLEYISTYSTQIVISLIIKSL